jgi:hypothetical protein
MIEGLMLTMTGDELQRLLDTRVEEHRQSAARWKRQLARRPDQQTAEEPLLPEHMCENEAERFEWRAEVLEFLRDHIDPSEVYRLGQSDLAFGELLPPKPGSLEQEEYEERNRVGFELERLTKRVGPVGGPEILLIRRDPDAE